jgi:hypothetical protein
MDSNQIIKQNKPNLNKDNSDLKYSNETKEFSLNLKNEIKLKDCTNNSNNTPILDIKEEKDINTDAKLSTGVANEKLDMIVISDSESKLSKK